MPNSANITHYARITNNADAYACGQDTDDGLYLLLKMVKRCPKSLDETVCSGNKELRAIHILKYNREYLDMLGMRKRYFSGQIGILNLTR